LAVLSGAYHDLRDDNAVYPATIFDDDILAEIQFGASRYRTRRYRSYSVDGYGV
jgi:hypothetical protein